MNDLDRELLKTINGNFEYKGAYNVRKNGESIGRNITEFTNIISKENKSGLDLYVKEVAYNEMIVIPVLITQEGSQVTVYNDFYIGKNASVTIIAGCGIHSEYEADAEHDGIHRFFLEEGASVKYMEKHYAEGEGRGKKIINPVTEIYMKEYSSMEMETSQIKGVDDANRTTKCELEHGAKLVINEKIMTHNNQKAKTIFEVKLNGLNSSAKVSSRAVAVDKSKQIFISNVEGNDECFGHVECDAILKDSAKISATPKIVANCTDAMLIHEATIGKIAGDQLIKLMTLGLSKEKAEETIINGFLK